MYKQLIVFISDIWLYEKVYETFVLQITKRLYYYTKMFNFNTKEVDGIMLEQLTL